MTQRKDTMNSIIGAILLSLVAYARSDTECCPGVGCFTDNFPFDHLPLPSCDVNPSFTLFTRRNAKSGQRLSKTSIPSVFNPQHQTVFIIHGFQNGGDTPWLPATKDNFLSKGEYNVVIVDWSGGSTTLWYPQAAANTRLVGKEVSLITSAMIRKGNAQKNIWCVGHSLGAHTCGLAGKSIKFGRITGLDPAGPLFENYPNSAGLWKTDAELVDVMHTMGKDGIVLDFGTLKPLGHLDFYPNGGKIQPGCINYHSNPKLFAKWGTLTPSDAETQLEIACSHERAIEYFMESIVTSCKFVSSSICDDERRIPDSCRSCGSQCQRMGFHAQANRYYGKFYLTTKSASPYCQN